MSHISGMNPGCDCSAGSPFGFAQSPLPHAVLGVVLELKRRPRGRVQRVIQRDDGQENEQRGLQRLLYTRPSE